MAMQRIPPSKRLPAKNLLTKYNEWMDEWTIPSPSPAIIPLPPKRPPEREKKKEAPIHSTTTPIQDVNAAPIMHAINAPRDPPNPVPIMEKRNITTATIVVFREEARERDAWACWLFVFFCTLVGELVTYLVK